MQSIVKNRGTEGTYIVKCMLKVKFIRLRLNQCSIWFKPEFRLFSNPDN